MSVFVLWEDRAISPIAKFGPHAFLTACVAQRLGQDRHALRRSERLDGKSCAGNANVLRELQRPPLWDTGVHVVAVLDTDKVHHRVPSITARSAVAEHELARWADEVTAAIRSGAPSDARTRLDVCFLDRNLETLIALAGRGHPQLKQALGKDLLARDKLLYRAAADDALPAQICAAMPSWDHLVATAALHLARHREPAS
ncbi:MAG: hypothetical protein H7138_13665 [Myxococcales bacterium]|nr:hypothetical protein [Myxococcales bacterium]